MTSQPAAGAKPADAAPPIPAAAGRRLTYRHLLPTRVWHWLNALTVFVLLMSGLMIFNAHPRLYWGEYGANFDRAWLQIGATPTAGYLRIGDSRIPTTGVLGRWKDSAGETQTRAFPHWATIPSHYNLAAARRWHLAFAWLFSLALIGFVIVSLFNRHFARDLAPSRGELSPRHIWRDIAAHARLRFPTGEAALRYNVLQKLSYGAVIFLILPLLLLTGLTMSPALNAAWPWMLDLFGGRQSARSIHFLCAAAMLAFIVIHLVMVVLSGPLNEVRSMITGRYRLPAERGER